MMKQVDSYNNLILKKNEKQMNRTLSNTFFTHSKRGEKKKNIAKKFVQVS